MDRENTAGLLLNIVTRAREVPKNESALAAWRAILGDTRGDADLMASIGRVMAMPSKLVQELQIHHPEHADTASHVLQRFAAAFNAQVLAGPFSTFRDQIDEQTVTLLRLFNLVLQADSELKRLSKEEISDLAKTFQKLHEEIAHSTIDAELKSFLMRHLSKILSALWLYPAFGSQQIVESIELLAGGAVLRRDAGSFLTSHELGRRILDQLNATAAIMTISVGVAQLPQALAMLTG